jgi:two-component system phosphate regulon sensor histidine kinase PhoR
MQEQHSPLGGYISDIVLSDLPLRAEALTQQIAMRLYLRRWLLMLATLVIAIFVTLYDLSLLPALAGVLTIVAGAAFIPREGLLRLSRYSIRPREASNSNESFLSILEGLPSPVIMLDSQHRILHFNSLAMELWPALRSGDHISSYIRDPGVLEAVAKSNATTRLRQMAAFEQRVPIERHIEAQISWIARADALLGSRTPAIMVHLRDLTEQERLERLRADFVTNASHELRTPLAALIGFIETLQGAARNDAAARDHFLEIMARQARRMARLIDNLLSLSRIEMRIHLKPQTRVDLAEIAAQVLSDLETLAERTGISFVTDALARPAWVAGDRDELIQVVANLVENAIKYGHKGGHVWVSIQDYSHSSPPRYVLTIRDDGAGIAENHLPRLTERFYRANEGGGEKSGTGLGLAIVKHVITRHRGELTIRSTQGKGSTFTIALGKAPTSNN